jgi:FlaG/FlaF family flagellin (archaellin)
LLISSQSSATTGTTINSGDCFEVEFGSISAYTDYGTAYVPVIADPDCSALTPAASCVKMTDNTFKITLNEAGNVIAGTIGTF